MVVEGLDPRRQCRLCLTPFEEHGQRQHTFVEEGQDPGAAIKNPDKKKRPEVMPRLIITPAPDLVLRQLLLRKGLITSEELEVTERELTIGTLSVAPSAQAASVRSEPPANG